MKQLQWFPGHMAKARRLIEEKLPMVDLIVELLDARIPYSSSNPMLNDIIKGKPKLVILNKSDLADPKETARWLEHLNKYSFAITASSTNDKNLIDRIVAKANEILKEKIEKDLKRGIQKRPIRIMVIGIPNVGKSTFINKLVGRSALVTGDKPGVTKSIQYIKIGSQLELLDNPGVLWPKFESEMVAHNLALVGSIKDNIMPIDDVAIYGMRLLDKYYPNNLVERYRTRFNEEDILDTYEKIGRRIGCLLPGNNVDYDKVSEVFLYDVRHGRLGNLTLERVEDIV